MKKTKPKTKTKFSSAIIKWYNSNKRDLPWRDSPAAYPVWLSEIILQQTRVNQGLPYYSAFIEAFPTIFDLAAASEQEVLRLWQGLGYYSRARNLHKCANVIVQEHNGIFPAKYGQLVNLPGIGKYTAAAIASIVFKEPVPVIDGNVYRVLARVFGLTTDISNSKAFAIFFQLSAEMIDETKPDIYNQGLMEFGALQCTPAIPDCEICPISDFCFAFENKKQSELPVKLKRTKVRKRYLNYFIFIDKDEIHMNLRGKGDIWQGLYDFFLVEGESGVFDDSFNGNVGLEKLLTSGANITDQSEWYKHILTHQRLSVRFYHVDISNVKAKKQIMERLGLTKFGLRQIAQLPKPILIDKYLKTVFF